MNSIYFVIIESIVVGHLITLPLLFRTWEEEFSTGIEFVSYVSALQLFLFLTGCGFVYHLIETEIPPKYIAVIGAFSWGAGVFCTAFVRSFQYLFLASSVVSGLGASLCFWVTLSHGNLPFHSVCVFGAMCGVMAYSFGISTFYGRDTNNDGHQDWRVAFMCVGSIGSFLVLVMLALMAFPEKIATTEASKTKKRTDSVLFFGIARFICSFGIHMPLTHMIFLLNDLGAEDETYFFYALTFAVSVSGALAVEMFQNMAHAIFNIDKNKYTLGSYSFSLLFVSVSILGFIGVKSITGMYVFVSFYGFGWGAFITSTISSVKTLGEQGFKKALLDHGVISGIGIFFNVLISHEMYRAANESSAFKYRNAAIFSGIAVFLGFIFSLYQFFNVKIY